MLCQRCVDERGVRIEQFQHTAILVKHTPYEEFGLLEHGGSQVVVERGKEFAVGRDELDSLELEPLHREAGHERGGTWIGQHAPDLGIEVLGQLPAVCEVEQLVVGHRAPEKIGEPRGELELVKRLDALGIRPVVGFDMEEKFR